MVLVVLFMIPRFTDPNRGIAEVWAKEGVGCLPNGHGNLSQHFHPIVQISVNGLSEPIPANVGLARDCMAEVHTHDASGVIHIESATAGKVFYLKNFFTVYGQSLERPGYSVKVSISGKDIANPADLVFKDKDVIMIDYSAQ